MMRALGPGSVSSVLKVGLDVFHVVLWIVLFVAVLGLFGLLIWQPFMTPETMNIELNGETNPERLARAFKSPLLPAIVAAGALYAGGLVFIVGRLRRVFVTLTQGDPFRPENVHRLRLIGFTLAGLELISYGVRSFIAWWDEELEDVDLNLDRVGEDFNLTMWFAVLVVFVLAEVFREGARLRREAELTI